ncbi:MAG: subtilase, partial [Marmoricola sp.]|nr:subtilase [Marmoricola sp.]
MAEHLRLPEPKPVSTRRSEGGPPPGGIPLSPASHGGKLRGDLKAALASLTAPRIVVEGVNPRGVFKIKAKTRLKLARTRGLTLLGDTTDWTYFVVPDDTDATRLRKELETYAAGKGNPVLTEFFGSIETIDLYGPDDRRDPRLPAHIDADGLQVDVLLWPSADNQEGRTRVGDVRRVAKKFGCNVISSDVRPATNMVRVHVDAACLDTLLNLMVVEKIRPPIAPYLEPSSWLLADANSLEHPEPLEVIVGIIDDGISSTHPVLAGLVADSVTIPSDRMWAPVTTHGTMVAGLAAFGDFEPALRDNAALPRPARLAVARVLEEDARNPGATHFPSPAANHVVLEEAIRHLYGVGARIINLSISDPDAYAGPHVSLWTETIDRLARELDIVIVVAAGNSPISSSGTTANGAHAHHDYPLYLHDPANRIAEPGIAATAVTVGSIARSGASSMPDGRSLPDHRAIAHENELSPFTRTGPGANGTHQAGAIKPEFVHYGGNAVWTGMNTIDTRDHGAAIVSTAQGPSGRLFGLASGTSFAAPRVARVAAEILHDRPDASANLVRALLGISARDASRQFYDLDHLRACGYGVPDPRRAVESDRNRVVMVHEGAVGVNAAVIHPIPMPPEFTRGKAERTIRVSIASDPPV